MSHNREILVTSALPYANGEIHLGHLLEYVETDIWTRFQKLRGHTCYYICADDAHGTPIMLRARQENIDPEELIERMRESHLADFKDFHIHFDNYHSTHSEENRYFSGQIFERLQAKGYITQRTVQQAYDEQAGMFLPDRFIRGECPKCGAKEQYGDCCEVCGATYTPEELINPVSVLSDTAPVRRDSDHLFFNLQALSEDIKQWMSTASVQTEIRNKLNEWFEAGLKDWNISRDAPYFGFEIPGYPGKYFYVWLDAPIGYIASFKNLCDREGIDFEHFWNPQSPVELHHFIGKDIAYFHSLFWPAMLLGAELRLPTAVHCHGFVTVNGQKMSKSRNTFITAKAYLQYLTNPDYLRYYFAAHTNNKIEDIDLNIEDFMQRVNSDLVGKFVNIASRCASFIHKYFDNQILCSEEFTQHPLYRQSQDMSESIADDYENLNYALAMRKIMALADEANRYIESQKPWDIAKQQGACDELHQSCSLGILLFARLVLYLKPTMPHTCEQCEAFLNVVWEDWDSNPFDGKTLHTIEKFRPLITRIEKTQTDALIASQ